MPPVRLFAQRSTEVRKLIGQCSPWRNSRGACGAGVGDCPVKTTKGHEVAGLGASTMLQGEFQCMKTSRSQECPDQLSVAQLRGIEPPV
jgi:hypothetical protein